MLQTVLVDQIKDHKLHTIAIRGENFREANFNKKNRYIETKTQKYLNPCRKIEMTSKIQNIYHKNRTF